MTKHQEQKGEPHEPEEMVTAGEPFSPEISADINDQNVADDEDEVTRLKRELAESRDKFLRLYSEFDNFRKRSMRERSDLLKSAGEDTIKALLPVLDDFERAKAALESAGNEKSIEGVALIFQKLHSILEQKGLKRMISVGQSFNEELHEAISMIPALSPDQQDKIIDEAECGYYLNDKVIRHAKVIVAK
jgi:molecular chaperone GrpE